MRFNRIAGVAGLAGAAMWIVGFVALPAPPGVGASPQEVLDFGSAESGGLFAYVYLVDVLPAIAFLALGVGLWLHLRREPGWSMLGLVGTAGLAFAMFGWGINDSLLAVQGDRNADLATIEASFELYNLGHVPAHASIAVLVLAFTIAGRRASFLSSSAVALGVFASVSALVVLPAAWVDSDAFELVHIISILAFVGWVAMASLSVLRAGEPVREPVDRTVPAAA